MPRYAAFLRGVMPTNAKMAELVAGFEAAGFDDVKTVLGSGNVLFGARAAPTAALERKAEAGMQAHMGKSFFTIVRPVEALAAMLDDDPFAALEAPAGAKRIVTFLRAAPKVRPKLPVTMDGAHILGMQGLDVFAAYVPGPKGAAFMVVLERTLGKEITTRTWDTVKKVVAKG
jgi:uncharacterized protein (DUF1697 family)